MLKFFNSSAVRLATVLLLAQAALLYSSIRPEAVPPALPLSEFPRQIGAWTLHKEGTVEPEVQEVLRADDLLTRNYVNVAERMQADLFIAAFRSQRDGKTPHSPKNCLPGSGHSGGSQLGADACSRAGSSSRAAPSQSTSSTRTGSSANTAFSQWMSPKTSP